MTLHNTFVLPSEKYIRSLSRAATNQFLHSITQNIQLLMPRLLVWGYAFSSKIMYELSVYGICLLAS